MEEKTAEKQLKKLEKARQVHNADTLFDSNVIRANDPFAEQMLLSLSERLVAKPEYGNIYFSLTSLLELLGPSNSATRIELLKRFQSLYRKLGDRVRLLAPERFASVIAEWCGTGTKYASADDIDDEICASIETGNLVGFLESVHKDWVDDRERMRQSYTSNAKDYQERYKSDATFRNDIKRNIELLGTANALDQCDDIAKELIVNYAKRPEADLQVAKATPSAYPCTWTYSLLVRLGHYAATLTEAEWKAHFKKYGGLLRSDKNDFLDAYIASTGGACGMLITNDEGLIDKLNFLHDIQPQLVRLQGFTVYDAFTTYNLPNGGKRVPSEVTS